MTDSKFSVTLSNIDLLGSQSTSANATLLSVLQKYHLHIKNSGEVLANVLSRMGALERWRTEQGHNIAALEHILPKVQYKDSTDQEQQEGFTENTIARLGSLEMWRGKHATSYGQLTRSVIDGESRLEKLALRIQLLEENAEDYLSPAQFESQIKEQGARLNDTIERHERLNEYVKGQDDPSSTFGDNVLASLQALRDGGQICELFAEDMRETARDAFVDCDISDQVEHALSHSIDLSDYVSLDNLDAQEMWEHISEYVEEHVSENAKGMDPEDEHTLTCAASTAEYNEEKIAMITSRLKQIGIALDPKDRSLYGDNRTPQEAFHDGMSSYADFLNDENRHLLAQFANDLLAAQNKEEDVVNALNGEEKSDGTEAA